jgi:hypothetical protein
MLRPVCSKARNSHFSGPVPRRYSSSTPSDTPPGSKTPTAKSVPTRKGTARAAAEKAPEGGAPFRYPLAWQDPNFYDEAKLEEVWSALRKPDTTFLIHHHSLPTKILQHYEPWSLSRRKCGVCSKYATAVGGASISAIASQSCSSLSIIQRRVSSMLSQALHSRCLFFFFSFVFSNSNTANKM